MRKLTPILLYKKAIIKDNFMFNKIQYKTIKLLDDIHKNMINNQLIKISIFKKSLLFLLKLMQKDKRNIKGVYLWGDPGCGKTWLINLFFQSINGNRKLHFDFYSLMLFIHKKLKILQGFSNPLLIIADQFKLKIDILFIDEFYISDITDAVIISNLIIELFKRNIILIITSNFSPNNLCHNKLQNNFFSSINEKINKHYHIINMNSGIDYRARTIKSICLWKFPLNLNTYNYMDRIFYDLSGDKIKKKSNLKINYRNMVVLGISNRVLSVDFNSICGEGHNQHDYVKLSRYFHTILVHNIPIMTYDNENMAKRFLLLIDELYRNHIKLVVSAETDEVNIYQGKKLKFEYKRCLSRIQEMQSDKYFLANSY
ncbi:cell division protein ZapE [Candidatus Pantoea edessiphila]|uniref:Cell division protein ZapE n=1 Tax=Candidatus Pantoea edessiphila TaxID=2044610 RepID=A0A2P5T221_9GAMM|nr:cell division protein ZapE [Candidatus Pantoea edessiphila]PPI88592.1 cell division protein ZapE [Candidatus Pantoea edessiphila]